MMNCIIVGLGGFLGAVARYLIGLIPLLFSGLTQIRNTIFTIYQYAVRKLYIIIVRCTLTNIGITDPDLGICL